MEFAPPPPPGGMNGAGASPGAPPETSPDSVAYTPVSYTHLTLPTKRIV